MNNKLHYIISYIKHFSSVKHRGGHGVHSPFVFNLIKNVLDEKNPYYAYDTMKGIRKSLQKDQRAINVEDFGTGTSGKRRICDILNKSSKAENQARLIFRMLCYTQPQEIIELGTCLGTTTAYMALYDRRCHVHTFEGSKELAKVAQSIFNALNLTNIEQYIGNIDNTLPKALPTIKQADLVFFDANHTYEATMRYYTLLKTKKSNQSVFIFDDIYYSEGMTKAWQEIVSDREVTVSIDLFHLGMVFFNPEYKKRHFNLMCKEL